MRGVPGGEFCGVLLLLLFLGELIGEANPEAGGELDGEPKGVAGTAMVTPCTAPCCLRLSLNARAISSSWLKVMLLLIRAKPTGPSCEAKLAFVSRLSVAVGGASVFDNELLRRRPGGSPCCPDPGVPLKLFDRFRSLIDDPHKSKREAPCAYKFHASRTCVLRHLPIRGAVRGFRNNSIFCE